MGTPQNLRRRRVFFRRRRKSRTVQSTMTMVDHLRELRSRIVKSLVAFMVISIAAFILYDPILDFFTGPLCAVDPDLLGPQGCDLIFTKVIGGFNFRLKLTALVGIALSSPVWLYQLWAFIVPALTSKERRYAVPFILSSSTLFLAGSAMAYLVMPLGIGLLVRIGGPNLVPLLGAEEYINFVGLMLLGFGVMFELPLVLFFLGLVGVLSVEQLRRGRRVAIVSLAAMAAIVTPSQDPYTMLLLLVPLYLFYEITILILARVLKRREARTV